MVKHREDDYALASPADTLFVMAVAESSLKHNRR